jgi:hypothetical protein
MSTCRPLSPEEITSLEAAGCRAANWSQVEVGDGFDAARVRRASFSGEIRIGALDGAVTLTGGVQLPAEIVDATLVDCTLGDNVRICHIGGCLANYDIDSGAVVTDVGTMICKPGATFGNGVELETVNEGGGREIRIFSELSSQFAYIYTMHRYRAQLIEKLERIVDDCVGSARSDRGHVGTGAVVAHVGHIEDVAIGPYAEVHGPSELINGTILSEERAPAKVGSGVVAEDFIIGEGSSVDSGAVLGATFIGQGVKIGKQFSAENSLFFANCEGFHGEACSIFAGPYTVTHHKSTLLIAGMYSFYNAGSGTNQSNHMYKLGPVHQGLVQRGSKTGSFSYMLWPSVLGPFSVVIGKHLNNFDARDLPFSYITDEGGESYLTPGMNMHTVGTIRDGEKWPARDRREGTVKRDLINFEVFSPYLVGKMLKAEMIMQQLLDAVSREVEQVRYKGLMIKRLLLRTGTKTYRTAVDLYLNQKITQRAAAAMDEGLEAVRAALAEPAGAVYSEDWADLSGLLLAEDRMVQIEEQIESGELADAAAIQVAFEEAWKAYEADEWTWVRHAYAARTGKSVDALTLIEIREMQKARNKAEATSIKKVLADAEKEFDDIASTGFGQDGDREQRAVDFAAVRGSFAGNSFIKEMQERLAAVQN